MWADGSYPFDIRNQQQSSNMEKIIYFVEDKWKRCAFRFVKNYKPRKWFRKEKIEYSFSSIDGMLFDEEELMKAACQRIEKDYPNAWIFCEEFLQFAEDRKLQRYWAICKYVKGHADKYYTGIGGDGKPEYSEDIFDARLSLDADSADETLQTIRQSTKDDRVWVNQVYLNLVNELLTPIFMITCTSKRSNVTKYLARIEGNRLRLVTTSDAAARFTFSGMQKTYAHLKQNNKNFMYAALPVFVDNVKSKDIESYMKEQKVSRMVVMDLQLKHLNRGNGK